MPGAAGPTGRAPRAHRLDGKWHPESVSIATRRGTRVRVQRRDRLTAAPGNGAVIAIAAGEPLFRVPPARSSASLCARDRRRTAETQSGSVHMWTAPDLQGLARAACSDRLRSYVRPIFGSCDHWPRWASRTVSSKHESGICCR